MVTMVGVGLKHPGVDLTFAVTPSDLTSFQQGCVAVGDIVVAYSGHVAFFTVMAESERPQDFPKALALLQTIAITFYMTVAIVVYYYAGNYVASPALGSASEIFKKVAFGLAVPTIVVAGVINAHVCVKNIYVRLWRGTNVMQERSVKSYGSWVGLCVASWIIAWLIASVIPIFNQLLGLLGSLFCTWFSLGLPAAFWLHMNKDHYFQDWKKKALLVLNIGILVMCFAVVSDFQGRRTRDCACGQCAKRSIQCGLGTYGSAWTIAHSKGAHQVFSCANNAV